MDQKYLIGYIGSKSTVPAAQLTSLLTPWSTTPKYRPDSVMRGSHKETLQIKYWPQNNNVIKSIKKTTSKQICR